MKGAPAAATRNHCAPFAAHLSRPGAHWLSKQVSSKALAALLRIIVLGFGPDLDGCGCLGALNRCSLVPCLLERNNCCTYGALEGMEGPNGEGRLKAVD